MTKTEQKQQELFDILLACGYHESNAAVAVDKLKDSGELKTLADYDWWINYYKWIYGDMLVSKGVISSEEYSKLLNEH